MAGASVGIGFDGPLPVRPVYLEVSEWGIRRPVALPRLFLHPFAGLLAQIVDVVFGDQDFDSVHELLGRTRVRRQHHVLFDEVHLDSQLDRPVKGNGQPAASVSPRVATTSRS